MIISNANDVRIQYNRINQTGYAGVIIGEDGMTIHRNVFRRCMSTLNDGGAVYVNANTATITENIILDTVGDLDSSHPWTPLGHGIWPEFLSVNSVIMIFRAIRCMVLAVRAYFYQITLAALLMIIFS